MNSLKNGVKKKSQKFNDKNFNQLFYEQMSIAAKKINFFSKSIKKNFKELELDDLITLVEQNQEN